MSGFLSPTQAAEILGVSRARVSQLISEGVIPVVGKMGRTNVLDRATIERLAREGLAGAPYPAPS